jgi:subtilisin family serine protease
MNTYHILCERKMPEQGTVPAMDEQFWTRVQDKLPRETRLLNPPMLAPLQKENLANPSFMFNLSVSSPSLPSALQGLRDSDLLRQQAEPKGENPRIRIPFQTLAQAPSPAPASPSGTDPGDARYADQKPYFERMAIPKAWKLCSATSDVAVAVLDSGVNEKHEDLGLGNNGCLDKYKYYSKFVKSPAERSDDILDPYGHGTLMAGVLGALTNNVGIAGLLGRYDKTGPRAHLIIVRTGFEDGNNLFYSNVVSALQYLRDEVPSTVPLRVVLLAWEMVDLDPQYADEFKNLLASFPNTLFVTSAGGYDSELGTAQDQLPVYPALFGGNKSGSLPNLVCAGAAYHDGIYQKYEKDTRVDGTCYSLLDKNGQSYIDVFAPGNGIWSLSRNDNAGYLAGAGSSFAAAHVAGIAALLFAKKPGITAAQVKTLLQTSKYADTPASAPDDETFDVAQNCVARGILHAEQLLKNC